MATIYFLPLAVSSNSSSMAFTALKMSGLADEATDRTVSMKLKDDGGNVLMLIEALSYAYIWAQ